MTKVLYSFGIILFGLFAGYALQIMVIRNLLTLPLPIDNLRKLLQKTALLFVNPLAIIGAIWIVNIQSVRLAALPFVGLFALIAGGGFALAAAKLMKLNGRKTGALFGCGSFTNIGSIGALVCFIFLGEKGFALVPIYKLFEELTYYSIGFPIAKYYSPASHTERAMDRVKTLFRDPFILVALLSIVVGGGLNLSGIERPVFFKTVVSVCVPLGTILLLISIGLALKFRRVRDYVKECIAVAVIKHLLVPASAVALAVFLGFGTIQSGLPVKVVLILASMPVAFNALIPPSIYDLDLDLANSCWFFTTAMLIVVLPVLSILIGLF